MPICPGCGEDNPPGFRLCGYCGTPLNADSPAQDVRKTITVVFSDLKESTRLAEQLDAEAVREVTSRYFDAFRQVLERHGGRVEKFIGDAVMAVFGLPRAHEDDALRAVRAAAEMRTALAALNDELERQWGVRLSNRTGVNTGEVVAGDPSSGQRLVTGDTVNLAARLEQAAPADEVLLGDTTYRLVRDAVVVETLEPLSLKGKSGTVPAHRLISVDGAAAGVARRTDTPMVGREDELRSLRDRLTRATGLRRCELLTIVAAAGVGKSRLVHEFLQGLDDDAQVLHGQCLPYGEGITFWALSTALAAAAAVSPGETQAVSRSRLDALVGEDNPGVADRLAAVMGLSSDAFPVEETFWATRRVFEALGARRPLVVVFDDIHWAEPTFLDLIQHLRETAAAPLLVVCTARHELVETAESWLVESANATVLELMPLSADHGAQVAANVLGGVGVSGDALERIVRATGGNPLYLEQTLSMLVDSGQLVPDGDRWELVGDTGELAVPPTISALLSARLDQLTHGDRAVIERASVVGETFYVGAVAYLTPHEPPRTVDDSLRALTSKQLVEPGDTTFLGEAVFSFRHLLIRDAAYGGLLKRLRAELHERFAAWLEGVSGARALEHEEIVGYHLEQAHLNLRELGPLDDVGRSIAMRAAGRLSSAGRRALARSDLPAAANLLERAVNILDRDDRWRLGLVPDLGEALIHAGRFQEADRYLEEALDITSRSGDTRLQAELQVVQMLGRGSTDSQGWADAAISVAEASVRVLEQAGDHAALSRAWCLVASVHGLRCQYSTAEGYVRRAIDEARLAGDRRQELINLPTYALSAAYGPTPVPQAIARCEQVLSECGGSQGSQALVLCALAHLHGLAGDFDSARAAYRRGRAIYTDLGLQVDAALVSLDSGPVELLAENWEVAERELRGDYDKLADLGDRSHMPTTAALLAHVLHELGSDDEALQLTQLSEEASSRDDVNSEVEWRRARALILAGRGEFETAERLGRQAVARAMQSDFIEVQGDAQLTVAEVCARAGRLVEAADAAASAIALYRQKQSSASEGRALRICAAHSVPISS